MAIVLKLMRDTTTLSLQGGSAGVQLMPGWTPGIARPRYGRMPPMIEEKMPVRVQDSSHDNLATQLQALHQMQMWAEMYNVDRAVIDPVWLHAKLYNETGERRAYVKRIEGDFNTRWFGPAAAGNFQDVPLVVERGPYWERPDFRWFPAATPAAAASVEYDYTAAGFAVAAHDIVGDAPARIAAFQIRLASTATPLDRFWIGIRSAGKRLLTGWEGVWECEDGTNVGSGATVIDEVDATASGGSRVTGTASADNTWEKYFTLQLQDVYPGEGTAAMGLFSWLLRSKVTAGTYDVQLRFGYYYDDDDRFTEMGKMEVGATAWDYYEMGMHQVPRHNEQARSVGAVYQQDNYLAYFSIQVWARRTSGAGNVHFDCVCPIAVDEGSLKISNAALNATASALVILQGAAGQIAVLSGALFYDTTYYRQELSAYTGGAVVAPNNWGLPAGDGRMDIVYARAASSVITDAVYINQDQTGDKEDLGAYYERWTTLRGSE